MSTNHNNVFFKKQSEKEIIFMEEKMTAKEIKLLSEWLKQKGMTYEEINECICYISSDEMTSEKE